MFKVVYKDEIEVEVENLTQKISFDQHFYDAEGNYNGSTDFGERNIEDCVIYCETPYKDVYGYTIYNQDLLLNQKTNELYSIVFEDNIYKIAGKNGIFEASYDFIKYCHKIRHTGIFLNKKDDVWVLRKKFASSQED